MKFTRLCCLVLSCFLVGLGAIPAYAQLKLSAQNISLTDTTITPPDPTVLAINSSPEILALDVPAMPSSDYVLISSTSIWEVDTTADAPVRAFFVLRLGVTSPALPPGVNLSFGVLMTNFRHSNNGSGVSIEGGTADDTEVVTRKFFADFLLLENPTLTADTAAQTADDLFKQGFHVSISARLTSRNVSSATVSNPNVAFLAQSGSPGKQ
jgi:hypothetical protein